MNLVQCLFIDFIKVRVIWFIEYSTHMYSMQIKEFRTRTESIYNL